MSKKMVRKATKCPGVYKNCETGKYDVKHCFTEVDPYTNKKVHRQKWVYGIKTYTEAKEQKAKIDGKGFRHAKEGCSLLTAMELWNEKAEASKYSVITIRNTSQQFKMICKFWAPDLLIDNITEEQYLKLIAACREYGYSEDTLYNINSCLRKIIHLAYKNRYIAENLTLFWDNPRIDPGVKRNVISRVDFEKLDKFFFQNDFYRLGVSNYPKYRFLVNLLYYSGIRIGEAIALNYSDFYECILKNRRYMRVNITKSYNSSYKLLKGVKNGKSRKIPLPDKVCILYKKILEEHLRNGGTMDARIITWDHSACRMMLEKACKSVGIRNYCCHDFRHTYISNLIRRGVPLPIIESASGDTQATILKHYSHMFVGDEQMLLDVLEDDDM